MTGTKWLLLIMATGLFIFASCAGVKIDYDNPAYLQKQLSEIPTELLNSDIVLNEEGESLMSPPLKVGEFLLLMITSQPLEQHSWINMSVTPNTEGSVLTIKQYTRGKLVLENTLYLTYQDGFNESRVDKIIWDDKRFDDKRELVAEEDKIGYSMMLATFLALQ